MLYVRRDIDHNQIKNRKVNEIDWMMKFRISSNEILIYSDPIKLPNIIRCYAFYYLMKTVIIPVSYLYILLF